MKNNKCLWGMIGTMFILGFLITGCTQKSDVFTERNLEVRDLDDFVHILEEHRNGVLANRNVVFVTDRAVKEHALETNYYAKRNFVSVDNPLLEVFYIDVEEIETYGTEGANVYIAQQALDLSNPQLKHNVSFH